jgi:catechol 2,3-dioxygenase-like lactoylglutathione lyase family enzyme
MRIVDRYPIIVTERIRDCRDFYQRYLGFRTGFESRWFIWMATEDHSASIAFMTPDHPSAPPGPETFSGKGLCLEIHVEDAREAYDELRAKNLDIEYPMRDEPFGQRRFGFFDPAGLWIDVVEQIPSKPGYWDQYEVTTPILA